ncbi:TPA: hypothetical protein ACIBE3_004977 [Salmonella enterica subsp. enterica serovar Reading]
MTRLNQIHILLLDIHKGRSVKVKQERISALIDYVEQVNQDVKEMRGNLSNPYLNENKLIQTLLEIQIQIRLMQTGGCKSFPELNIHLFNIRVLIDKARNKKGIQPASQSDTCEGTDRRRYRRTGNRTIGIRQTPSSPHRGG